MEFPKEIHPQPHELRCPRCYSLDVAPSLQRGVIDHLMARWGRVPKHCRYCGRRFYKKVRPQPPASPGA